MALFGFGVVVNFKPYLEDRDNMLGSLSSVQIFFVMLSALVMKRSKGVEGISDYDAKYLGLVLILLNVGLALVLVCSGMVPKLVKLKYNTSGDDDNDEGEGAHEVSASSLFNLIFVQTLGCGRKKETRMPERETGAENIGIELGQLLASPDRSSPVKTNNREIPNEVQLDERGGSIGTVL
jgi:hypothetical protein